MKTPTSKSILSLVLISCITVGLYATEVNKTLKKEFDVKDNSVLVLMNKYGKVDIENWDQNKVSIEVLIKVEHSDKERAIKLLDYLNVEFSSSGNELKAITNIDQRFSKIRDKRFGNNYYSINYTVKMPADLDIDLTNKYGDTHIDELSGHARIDIKYGNLQANKIVRDNTKPLSSLILGYGKATIGEVNWFKVETKYSKLRIEKSRALILLSKYSSKIFIGEASSIVAESKYDNYEVGKCDNFVLEGAYSNYSCDYVGKKLNVTTKYSGILVKRIPAGFKEISITIAYGGVKLGIDPDASYYLKGESKYAKISFPSDGRMNKIVSNTESSYEGTVGTDPNPKARINVSTRYGSVYLDY